MNTLILPSTTFSPYEAEENDTEIDVMLKDLFADVHNVPIYSKSSIPTSSNSWTLSVPAADGVPHSHDSLPTSAETPPTSSGSDSGPAVVEELKSTEDPRSSARAARLAKKRTNQRIYREREKQQRQEATARLAELEAMLSRLSMENGRLKLKNNALEQFVSSLDYLVAGLVGDPNAMIEPRFQPHPDDTPQQQAFKRFVLVKTAQDMTTSEFRKTWRYIVMEGAALLLQVDAGSEQAIKEMEVSVPCVERMMFNLKIMHPGMMDNFSALNLETGDHEEPGVEYFVRVVRGLNLSDEQLEQLLDESVIVGASTQLEDVRLRLLQELGNFAAASAEKLDSLRAFQQGEQLTDHSLHACYYGCHSGAVQSLEKMLKQEGLLGALLCTYIFHTVMTSKQKVLMSVSSYPYLTNPTLLLEAIKVLKAERVQLLGSYLQL